MAFMSSSNNNSTNEAVNTAQVVNIANEVSTAGTQVNYTNIDNLSDAVICAFLAIQPSSPQLEESSILMGMRLLPLIKPMWNISIAIRRATLQENVKHQECKTTRTGRAHEGMCILKLLTLQLWCLVMDLEDMIGVTKLKKDLTMYLCKPAVETLNAKISEEVPKVVKKDNAALIIEDWKSDDEDE
nr:hypothetical protein [Tanacetum cinerariifolium]